MSSSFLLELDTIGPEFIVDAPGSSRRENVLEMYLRANEPLDYQDIRFINNGIEYKLTFSLIEPTVYFGFVNLEPYEEGMSKFIITLGDTVLNKTTKEFNFFIGNMYKNLIPRISIGTRDLDINILDRNNQISVLLRDLLINIVERVNQLKDLLKSFLD